jgi:hypothetical protein
MTPSCAFTQRHYRQILEQAQNLSFELFPLRETHRLVPGKKQIVLRHDIDFSVEDARRMATVEKEMGVTATYCVLLHAPTYHVGDRGPYRDLCAILNMGHELALHYDIHFFEEARIPPVEGIEREAAFLGGLFGTPIVSLSQHKPGTDGFFTGVGSRFIDAYSPRLMKEIRYISDSKRTWRAGCVHEHLETTPTMQLLVHPEWWEEGEEQNRRGTISRVVRLCQDNITRLMEEYAVSMEGGGGRPPAS